jgi:hydrogenase maturation protease
MRIVVCGIGNKDRGDDAFGPYVVEQLRAQQNVLKIDCGLYPENQLNEIIAQSPDVVIFLDAVEGEEVPVLLRNDEITDHSALSVTTHKLPFSAVYMFLRENGVPDVLFLGVPAMSFETCSKHVKDFGDRIASVLNDVDKKQGFSIMTLYEALSEQLR